MTKFFCRLGALIVGGFWLIPIFITLIDVFSYYVLGTTTGLYAWKDQPWADRIFLSIAWTIAWGLPGLWTILFLEDYHVHH